MSLGVFVAAGLLIWKNIWKDRRSGEWRIQYPATSITPLFILVFLYLLFQLVPLPESVLRLLSPEALVVQEKGVPASQAVASAAKSSPWLPLAAYAHPVRESLILWVTYGLFFLGFSLVLTSQEADRDGGHRHPGPCLLRDPLRHGPDLFRLRPHLVVPEGCA